MSERQSLASNNSNYGSTSNENSNKPPSPPNSPFIHITERPTIWNSLKLIFTNSWLNVLLIFIPFGFIAALLNWSDTWVFTLNFFAIIPLAKLLEFATEDISLRVGQVFIYYIIYI
jgi:Ca2+:H+ antiporter